MSLFDELKRRNVFRVATAYLVVGWLLTEVLTTILPTLGAPDWMPRAVILVFAFGFIPTVVFSWIYELTPEGIKREYDVDREASVTPRTGKLLDYVTVGGVVVLVLFLALFSARQPTDERVMADQQIEDASVAVLPFVNLSSDEDNEYFSDGLTETLLHMLTQIPDLKVAARTSSFAFKDDNKTIREISAALGVAHVLEGSVQRAGDRVRVTAQLIRAEDGFHVWSSNYDRTLDDIFGIQDEIAEKVGGALSESLLGTAPGNLVAGVATDSTDAYDLYLQALRERATFSYGGLQASEDLLKGALTIDPGFIEAKVALANNYLAQVETGLMATEEAFAQVAAITGQVLAAEPDNVGARAAALFAEVMSETEQGTPEAMTDAVEQFESLVVEDPADFSTRTFLTRVLIATQQDKRALEVMKNGLKRDPLNPRVHYELGSLYIGLNEPEKAREALFRSLEIEPSQPNAYAKLANLGLQSGDGLEFLQHFLKAVEVDPKDHELPGIIASFLYELDLIEEADDFRNRVMATAPTSAIAYRLDLLRAINSGDEAAGIASAQRAIEADVADRRFAFGGAAQYLLRRAAKTGTVAETTAWLEAQAPGILDIDADNVPMKYRSVQYSAFDAWYTTLPREELLARLDKLIGVAESFGVDVKHEPNTAVEVLALRGETEEAIEVALNDVFSESVATHLNWERTFSQAQYEDVVADPRIQAAMQRWQEEENSLRDQIQVFLADLQASI